MTKIRTASIEDAPFIADAQVAMAAETESKILDRTIVQEAVEAVFDDPGKGFYLVAERGEDLCGSLLITYEWSDWRNGNMWYIQSVFVTSNHRGQGVFRALFDVVESMAREHDVRAIRLYVETENHRAQAVYESLGMKRMPYLMYDLSLQTPDP